MPQEKFFVDTARGIAADQLAKLWQEVRKEEPDLDRISEALDQTHMAEYENNAEGRGTKAWVEAARGVLML